MIYKISKKQFNAISKKLIKHFFGELFFYSNGYKTKSYNDIINHIYDDVENVYDYNVDYIEIVDSLENNIMDIWFNEGNVKKGCKNQLRIHLGQVFPLEQFLPILRKKEFSKVIKEYIYDQLKFDIHCLEFDYDYKEKYKRGEDTPSKSKWKTYKYKPKNKKK